MKVLAGEKLGQISPPPSREWGENRALAPRPVPRTPPTPTVGVDDDDDWDPTFYVPALLVVLAANVAALWWLAVNTI